MSNYLSNNQFSFSISKIPGIEFTCQQVNLPSLTLPEAEIGSSLSTMFHPGDKLVFDPLTINFLVEEDLQNYLSLYEWMVGLGAPEAKEQYKKFKEKYTSGVSTQLGESYIQSSDITLFIMTNNSNLNYTVKFVDAFPISLGELSFNSADSDQQYLTSQVSFRYSYYYFDLPNRI